MALQLPLAVEGTVDLVRNLGKARDDTSGEHHADAGAHAWLPHVCGIALVLVDLVLRQDLAVPDGSEVLGVVNEPAHVLGVLDGAWCEGGSAELASVHAGELGADPPAPVPVDEEADHLLDAHELVDSLVSLEAENLDDAVDIQLLAAFQEDLLRLQALDGVDDHLRLLAVAREEVDIADTEPGLLPNRGSSLVFVRHDAVVGPRVVRNQVVHRRHELHHHRPGRRVEALVDPPGHYTGHGQVLPAADEKNLVRAVLDASSDVLDSEGAEAKHRRPAALHVGVVELAEHPIADLALEDVLALVLQAERCDERAGVASDC
mmetsp:Transcript_33200/g.75602  ORF Transcript_33200/g.75602 Transcript_33200/m.75602 type:complete len:319 (-) Transcript_33200:9-965(-)